MSMIRSDYKGIVEISDASYFGWCFIPGLWVAILSLLQTKGSQNPKQSYNELVQCGPSLADNIMGLWSWCLSLALWEPFREQRLSGLFTPTPVATLNMYLWLPWGLLWALPGTNDPRSSMWALFCATSYWRLRRGRLFPGLVVHYHCRWSFKRQPDYEAPPL